jgi:DNA-binding NarL/FixJ family response regulator
LHTCEIELNILLVINNERFIKSQALMYKQPLSVIYVENDPALRGLVTTVLKSKPEVSKVFDFETGEEAISFAQQFIADVALIDVSLGSQVMDGVAVGTQLRILNSRIGIVLFTQHSFESISPLANPEKRDGWSFFQKQADSNIDQLVEVLQLTAQGKRAVISSDEAKLKGAESSTPVTLSTRQHLVLSMLATGIEPKAIAERLGISFDSVRKDLSNAYSILVPHPEPGTDLRVTSILRYQQLINSPLSHA